MDRSTLSAIVRRGVVAGAAGGVAEIIWVSVYALATGGHAATLARGVTTAAGVSALLPASPVMLGVVVHMALAVALGTTLAFAWQSLSPRWAAMGVLAALVAVWFVNFFVILPVLSPDFVQLVPYPVSLLSKLLFGLAAVGVLRHGARRPIATGAV